MHPKDGDHVIAIELQIKPRRGRDAPGEEGRATFPPMLLALLACARPPVTAAPERALVAVELAPGDDFTVRSGEDGGEGVQFTATLTWDDGEVEDGTATVEWSSSNQTAGTIDASGWFQPTSEGGGITWVSARLAGVEDTVTVTVRWSEELIVGKADPSLFSGTSDTQPAELWLYPEDAVTLPRNTPGITFQWAAPDGVEMQAWRLRFSSTLTDFVVYTTGLEWRAEEDVWQAITATNAGGSVQVELAGVWGTTLYKAPAHSLGVNRFDARGSIVYWSTSAAGFMKIPYGSPAEPYLVYEQTGYCMACHAISNDGRVAFTYDGGNGSLGVKDADRNDIIGYGQGYYANFKAWSPDGSRLVGSYGGILTLYETSGWANLGSVPLTGSVSHPDWSPDGTRIVVSQADTFYADWVFAGGKITTIDVLEGDRFGEERVLYTPPAGYNAYYPAFSPDGEWVAFNLSTGDAYSDTDAELWVVPTAGGDAVRLGAANKDVELMNSWSRWGPLPDDDILWLAFSSTRAYGRYVSGTPQIWVSAFDPEKARQGLDPSAPAFWLPDQDYTQNNHVPVWTR